MQEPHRILPTTILTPPVSLKPHFALPKSPPILVNPWPLEPQETHQVGDLMFFSCSKSLIPAGVGTLASRSQEGPTLQAASVAALSTPGLGQAPGTLPKAALLNLLFRFRFGARRFSLLADCYLPILAPAKAELSAPRSWETGRAGDP